MPVFLTKYFVYNQQPVCFDKVEEVPFECLSTVYYVISITTNETSINITFYVTFANMDMPLVTLQNHIQRYSYTVADINSKNVLMVGPLVITPNSLKYSIQGLDISLNVSYYYRNILRVVKNMINTCVYKQKQILFALGY